MEVNFLHNLSKILSSIVSMVIKLGVNYKEFDLLSKEVFINQAGVIISADGKQVTDADISALMSIYRSYMTQNKQQVESKQSKQSKQWISFPVQVVTTWTAQNLEKTIFYRAEQGDVNFVNLVKRITTEKPPKTILNELVRLKHIKKVANKIHLTVFAVNNNPKDKTVLMQDFSDNLVNTH